MEFILLTLVISLLIFFIVLFLINNRNKDRTEEIELLEMEIMAKEEYLLTLDNRIQNSSLDRGTGLTQTQIKVLDKYERSNIRIPVDILEELPYIVNLDEKDTLEYIEHLRNHWKLENSKKVYKK